jgi:hypothetical protein
MASGSDPLTSDTLALPPEGRPPAEPLREMIRQQLAAALRSMEHPLASLAGASGKFGLDPWAPGAQPQ